MKTFRESYFEDRLKDEATVIVPNGGERYEMGNIRVSFKVTSEMSNDQLGVYEIALPPKTVGAKLHYHRFMDETFIINEGTVTLEIGNKKHYAKPGTVSYVPRFTPHGFRNDTEETAKLTLVFNPAQRREGFFKGLFETLSEVPVKSSNFLKLYNKYDSFPVDTSNMIPIEENNVI
ncbi:cupin domain-containing protein [Flagellimonas taeanensis]|uniref:cupin domain-containing protein n=1 Tax=Flavobacteriaceae TaxID=49546 RepID=UPI000E67CBF9|nr:MULTISPECIES: cupin domain-containing protein [Allomuricauda]MDC6385808.1 cupin domain-containing protein [Muricauda sp. SK9]RIV50915.1 cupin domain-containing protein [Allomuricauda taeanensis]